MNRGGRERLNGEHIEVVTDTEVSMSGCRQCRDRHRGANYARPARSLPWIELLLCVYCPHPCISTQCVSRDELLLVHTSWACLQCSIDDWKDFTGIEEELPCLTTVLSRSSILFSGRVPYLGYLSQVAYYPIHHG